MSLVEPPTGSEPGAVSADHTAPARRTNASTLLLAAAAGIVLLSLVRVITGANDITSVGAFGATISGAIPIAMAGLGGLWSERSGVVNIGLEGMMILGTWFGAAFAYFSGSPWLGIIGGIVGGAIGGLIHAVATVTFGVDQIVSGVAITILSTGLARYLSGVFFTGQKGGGPTQSPSIPTFDDIQVPGLGTGLTKIAAHHWFLISDICGFLGAVFSELTPFTVLMILMVPLTWFVLWRTALGLRIRSCGENPTAAETLGIGVYRMKYIGVVMSGMLAGLGGAFLADAGGIYREGQTGGRGYIGLAAMIFGNWRPGGLAAGAGLFGYTDAVQQRQGSTSVHALLLLVAFILALLGGYLLWQRRIENGVLAVVGALLFFLWYTLTDSVPIEFVPATPYVITLLVLALASQRLRPPAADGIPWRRGQGG